MHCRFALLVLALSASELPAECIELKILHREPFAESKSFGDVGPYERIVGIARFAIDPMNARNKRIVDVDKAPLNRDGKIEFQADFFMLTPKDLAKGNGAILYDVNNRGNKLALGFFNDAPSNNDPKSLEDAGNGFLMRRGYTLVWCGWIGELLPGGHRLLLQAPMASDNGKPITGIVRFETACDVPSKTLPLSRRPAHGSFNPTAVGAKEGVLTWRMRETDPPIKIPREEWTLQRIPPQPVQEGVAGTLAQIRLKVSGGFRPGYLYELICECENSIVQGVGLAAVRDLVSFLKFDASEKNPLARDGRRSIDLALGFGVSQSGRFLRHFVYEGFNADERGRKVFDGLMPHVSGAGLGFFNQRFAQPTRHNAQHEEHLYPADMFPFTYGEQKHCYFDREGKIVVEERVDGIFNPHAYADIERSADRQNDFWPMLMHTQSGSEYWNRSGSLVHTDPCGQRDAFIPPQVRIYTFGSAQHGPAPFPPKPGIGDNLPNPGNFKPLSRALLDALYAWAKFGTAPPDSVYPKIADQTLVDWKQSSTGFPSIPGVRYPEVIQQPSFLNRGPNFMTRGIIDVEPPEVLGHYRVLVPRSDKDGNDLGTLLPPEVAVPLATYADWNLRKREVGAEGMLLSLNGSYLPFPQTKAKRLESGEQRLSIEERYTSFEDYEMRFRKRCEEYVGKRFLLQEDVDRLVLSRALTRGEFPTK